jgi:hypothetical protein
LGQAREETGFTMVYLFYFWGWGLNTDNDVYRSDLSFYFILFWGVFLEWFMK